MIEKQKIVGFVCLANYCRSPVAANLFKKKFNNSFKSDSAGINPMITAGMDLRSVDYLKYNDVAYEMHTPKKIDKKFINSSHVIFAMDAVVLMQLNKTFKNYRNKFKLFTYQHRNIQINDPYKLSKEKYESVMNKIKFVIDRFEVEELC